MTPSSPKDNWMGFFDRSANDKRSNKELQAMMKGTHTIHVSDLELVSYRLPDVEIRTLIESYERRKREEEDQRDSLDENNQKDNFWDELEETADKTGQPKISGNDDFWDQIDNNSDSSTSSEASGDEDFWARAERSQSRHAAEILIEDRGVKTRTGKILIPYRNWKILSYREGIAKVKISEYKRPIVKVGNCGTVSIADVSEGYVDARGSWITSPKVAVRAFSNMTTGLPVLEICPASGCRKKNRNALSPWQRCQRKLRQKVREIEASYK